MGAWRAWEHFREWGPIGVIMPQLAWKLALIPLSWLLRIDRRARR